MNILENVTFVDLTKITHIRVSITHFKHFVGTQANKQY